MTALVRDVSVAAVDDLVFLEPADERWLALAASCSGANIFHHPAWSALMAECYGYRPFVVAAPDEGDGLRAGLPMIEMRRPIARRRWVSLPFTDHCAPLYRDPESLEALTGGLARLSKGRHTPDIEVRWPLAPRPEVWAHSQHVLHTLQLGADVDEVARRIKKKHRRLARAAEQRGVRVVWGETRQHLDLYYQLHLRTRRRLGVPVQPRRFFDLLWQRLIAPGLGFMLLAWRGDECLAGAVFLHWQQTLTYKYSALDDRARPLSPNDLLLWTAIRWGCEHGFTTFDMGRTGLENTGLRQFKGRWGAQEMPLVYSTFSAAPPSIGHGRLLSLARRVIRGSPPWVCRVAGELLYGRFG